MTELSKDKSMEEMVKPPFPNKMTFREKLESLFNTDWMTDEELKTICDAGEMYANGCLKQQATRSLILIEALEKIVLGRKNNETRVEFIAKAINLATEALTKYHNHD